MHLIGEITADVRQTSFRLGIHVRRPSDVAWLGNSRQTSNYDGEDRMLDLLLLLLLLLLLDNVTSNVNSLAKRLLTDV